ncbi:MAG: transglutaminase [Burkholderiales bacterium RIFCSPLOWO2_12_FULL_61_40]|nr:MAG: transglutaminase [Burkholderiales bacterium RIFCSPLOWO2_12_FULL_61_40]
MLQPLSTLPREARDTLFLLAVIAWIIAPLVGELPVWCSAMAALLLLWRGVIALRSAPLPSRWWLMGLLLLAIAATLYTHRTLMGRDAGVTFIVVLLALKTLEMRARRDAFVIFFLGFFTLLSNFFFSQSLLTAASMLVGLLGLLTALVNSHMPVGRPPLLQAAKTAGWMALLGAPIMAVLFVLFPRLAPLWGVPSDAMSGRSGLSANMQVGTIAKLALDSSIAMRIRFDGAAPEQRNMYFRGPVLSTFDGREWRPLYMGFPPLVQTATDLQVQGPPVKYQVTLEANNRPWLLVLDATPERPDLKGYTPTMTPDLQWVVERPMADLVRYRAESYPVFRHGPLREASALTLVDYLRLPFGFNPRTAQLALEMRRDPRLARADTSTLVNAVMERLRTGGYQYTLEPGVYGSHTADEFWFDRKEGFCEHIASSFVLLMRALNVPARVVTGYQGGELNGVDGFWTVRQSDAHAWAEVWVAGQGWVRVDPTSAVAPGRTGSLQRLESPSSAFTQALVTVSPAFALNLRALWEATNNRWNQWVLNYSQAKQLDMLRNLGFESPSWEDLSYVLIAIVVLASLVGAAWALWERHRQDPWLRLYHRATLRLQNAGLALPPNTPPRQMAALLKARSPATDAGLSSVHDWLLRLEAWRYAAHGKDKPPALGLLQREFRQLSWPKRLAPLASARPK